MSQLVNTLNDRRRSLETEIRGIIDAAGNRKLTSAEEQRITAIDADARSIDDHVAQLLEAEERANDVDDMLGKYGSPDAGSTRTWLPSRSEYRSLIEQRAVGSSGNPYLPVEYSSQWWDRLRSRSVVLSAGPQIITTDMTSVSIPKVTASVTVSALAENTGITPSDPTFGSLVLTPKKLAALTLVANEALDDSAPDLRQVISEDLIRQTATALDLQFLLGSGSGANMTGLKLISGTTAGPNLGTNGGTPSLDNMATMVESLETANATMDTAAWFMAPRTWSTIRRLKDSQNRYQLEPAPTLDATRSLFGAPVYVTSNLPVTETKGTSTDCSTILLADMSQVVVAQRKAVEVQYSMDYAFNADQTAIRVLCRFDIGAPNATAVVVTTGARP